MKQASARPKQPEHSKPRPVSYRSFNHTPASSRTLRQANLLESTQETGKGNKPRKRNKAEHDLDSPTKQEQAQQTGATPDKRKQAQQSHSNPSNTSTNSKKIQQTKSKPDTSRQAYQTDMNPTSPKKIQTNQNKSNRPKHAFAKSSRRPRSPNQAHRMTTKHLARK